MTGSPFHVSEELNKNARTARTSSTAAWVGVALIVHVMLISPFLIVHGPTWFLHLGREFEPPIDLAREKLGDDVVVPHEIGHDGKSFWVLARDPLLTQGADIRHFLDRPAYRAQRIAYPLIASPWGLGGEHLLLWGLIITNLGTVA